MFKEVPATHYLEPENCPKCEKKIVGMMSVDDYNKIGCIIFWNPEEAKGKILLSCYHIIDQVTIHRMSDD